MFFLLSFILSLAIAGGGICYAYLPFPPLLAGSLLFSNLLLGGMIGGLLALLFHSLWRRVASLVREEGAEIRLLNGLFVGLAFSLIGIVGHFALRIAFPAGPAVRIAQGFILFGSMTFGLRMGLSFENPLLGFMSTATPPALQNRQRKHVSNKILDTSIIIDGRIGSLLSTGFIEGEILVPEFILAELQNIADSSNSLRRRKGRRGLDVLTQLMQDEDVPIRILAREYPAIKEVDRKLIHLAKDENATLITTDYNLNRVAQVEGVRILNVNELANAVKPRFIPGEELAVEIIDRGEEINQGVGYLDDGTMVVVENGRRHIGRTIKATVKSTLQTEAGRMLFVEPAGESPRWER